MTIASEIPPLITQGGEATAIGIWVLMSVIVLSATAFVANQVMGFIVKRKEVNGTLSQTINPQPLIVAMEKEFIHRSEYERRHGDVENQIKETRKYAHDEVHGVRGVLQSMQTAGEGRDSMLHTLDERTKNQIRALASLDGKFDRMADRMADKIEAVLRDDRRRHNNS